MTGLLVLRERLRNLYSKYDRYIGAAVKFLLMLSALLLIGQNLGYLAALRNPVIVIGLSLLCAFLPAGAMTAVTGLVFFLHLSAVSTEVMLVTGAVLLLMCLLYFSFKPGNGWLMVASMAACFLHVPGALLIAAGLVFSPMAAVPVIFGLILQQLADTVQKNYMVLNALSADASSMQKLTQLLDGLVQNQYLLLFAAAMAATVLLVYLIRRLAVNYAWLIAIVTGILTFLVVTLAGNLLFDITMPLWDIGGSAVCALALGLLAYVALFTVDYRRTEYVQFEDDDYYYYVKAVPKLSVSMPDIRIQKINARKIVHTQTGSERGQSRKQEERK